MRKVIYLLAVFCALAFNEMSAQKNFTAISGKILNKNSDFLMLVSNVYRKKINVAPDGSFADTLHIAAGNYFLYDGKEQKDLYLKEGFNIKISVDAGQFDETISYSGKGAEINNYLARLFILDEKELEDQTMFELSKKDFSKKVKGIVKKHNALLKSTKNLEPDFIKEQKKQFQSMEEYLTSTYEEKEFVKNVLFKGAESPKFVNYENHKGGVTSLEDLKGRYVYIDLWATWCGPCKAEIPALKEAEKRYHGRNIEFVSISMDDLKDHDKWKNFVTENQLSGIQLMADKSGESDFIKAYKVSSIPRFILLDPQGRIISALAPRPSEETFTVIMAELKI